MSSVRSHDPRFQVVSPSRIHIGGEPRLQIASALDIDIGGGNGKNDTDCSATMW
jgi:hypothetical protein